MFKCLCLLYWILFDSMKKLFMTMVDVFRQSCMTSSFLLVGLVERRDCICAFMSGSWSKLVDI